MDRPDYLDEDDEFQEAVKAERSKILRAKRNRAQTLRSPSVSSALARAGTIQMTELKNGPSRKPLRNGLAQVVSFDIALLPETIVPWVADIAERMQYPPDFVPIPAMVALGAVRALCKHTSPTTRPAAAAGPMAASERLPNGRPPDSRIRDASQPILNGLSRSSRRSRAQQPAGIRPRCLSGISPKQRWADSPPMIPHDACGPLIVKKKGDE